MSKTISDQYAANLKNQVRVLVTGATGFVGRHLVSELLKNGYRVAALVRDPSKANRLLPHDQLELYPFDISRDTATENLAKFDVVIHCAWDSVNNTESAQHIEHNFLHHYLFLKSLIKLGIKKLIVTGSCYEYGCQYGPVSPSTPTYPSTPYGLAKDMLHKSLRLLQRENSFNLIWARLFYIYGDGQNPNSVIPLFDQALARGDTVFNMSWGEQLLDYLPIEQATDKIVKLICQADDNGTFNISSGVPISLRRFLEHRMVEKNKHIKLNLGFYEYRKNDSLAIWSQPSAAPKNLEPK